MEKQWNSLERLGYGSDDRVLVVHADDLGLSHSVNVASFAAIESGVVSSASVMAPCAWFPEVAHYYLSHPHFDFGLHLTLTSEWSGFRWRPVTSGQNSSLVDPNGYFPASGTEAVERIDITEAEAELQAQIDCALSYGIEPTHLDSHMYLLYQSPELFKTFLRVGARNGFRCVILKELFDWWRLPSSLLRDSDFVIERTLRIRGDMNIESTKWEEFYLSQLRQLPVGITQMIVHLGYDDDEMRAVTGGARIFGSAWRFSDFEFLCGNAFKRCIEKSGILITNWREISRRLGDESPESAGKGG